MLPRGVIGLFPARPREYAPAALAPPESTRERGAPLEVAGLRKTFGGLVAVDDLTFSVKRGELIGLIGPNGSGKTTVLNLISGALTASDGSIVLKGHDLPAWRPPHRRLGASPAPSSLCVSCHPSPWSRT